MSRVRAPGTTQFDTTPYLASSFGGDLAERHDRRLRRAVVDLPGVRVDARRGAGVHHVAASRDARLVLLAPVRGGPPRRREVTLEVHPHDGVEVVLRHVDEHAVAEDAGVVHEDVELAELADRERHQRLRPLPTRGVVDAGDRAAAAGADLGRDLLGRAGVVARSVVRHAGIVDDDRHALLGQQQRVLTAETAAGAGHQRHPPVEFDHLRPSDDCHRVDVATGPAAP